MPDDDDGARGGKGRAEGAGLRTQRECSCPFDGERSAEGVTHESDECEGGGCP